MTERVGCGHVTSDVVESGLEGGKAEIDTMCRARPGVGAWKKLGPGKFLEIHSL